MKNKEIVCPHCKNNIHIKRNGHYKGEQVYSCSKCNKTFRLSGTDKRIKHSPILRKLALSMYLSGTSIRGIQKVLNVSFSTKLYHRTILCWIKNANSILQEELNKETQRRKEENPPTGEKTIIPIVEMDELYTYVKKNQKIPKEENTMINEYGLLLIDSEMKLLHLR
jgi:transposase-like protein